MNARNFGGEPDTSDQAGQRYRRTMSTLSSSVLAMVRLRRLRKQVRSFGFQGESIEELPIAAPRLVKNTTNEQGVPPLPERLLP
jgi:hypothetical protein